MVLIALFLGCAAPQSTPAVAPVLTVHTAVTVHEPASDNGLTTGIEREMKAAGLTVRRINNNAEMNALGTTGQRSAWLTTQTEGALNVLVEAGARRRANLGGRFQWEISTTVVVSETGKPSLEESRVLRITMPHSHQDASAALMSAAPRIGQYAATKVRQFHGSAE